MNSINSMKAMMLVFLTMFANNPAGVLDSKAAVPVVVRVSGTVEAFKALAGETSGYTIELDEPLAVGQNKVNHIEIDQGYSGLGSFLGKKVTATGTITGRRGIKRGYHRVIRLSEIKVQHLR